MCPFSFSCWFFTHLDDIKCVLEFLIPQKGATMKLYVVTGMLVFTQSFLKMSNIFLLSVCFSCQQQIFNNAAPTWVSLVQTANVLTTKCLKVQLYDLSLKLLKIQRFNQLKCLFSCFRCQLICQANLQSTFNFFMQCFVCNMFHFIV